MTIHYATADVFNFISALQEQAMKFTKAKLEDEYSYRIHNTPFMEFDQGVQSEPEVLLEVGFRHVPAQKFTGNAASFHKSEIVKFLQALIAESITPNFAAMVAHDALDALSPLGEVYVISVMPDYVILGFQKNNVIFVRHKEIVKNE